MISSGFPDNETTLEGFRKAISLKFFGDIHDVSDKVKTWLKSLSFKRVEWNGKVEYYFSDSVKPNENNQILKCHLLYTTVGETEDDDGDDDNE